MTLYYATSCDKFLISFVENKEIYFYLENWSDGMYIYYYWVRSIEPAPPNVPPQKNLNAVNADSRNMFFMFSLCAVIAGE